MVRDNKVTRELKTAGHPDEGIYGVRCIICNKLVEDMSDTDNRCISHVDNEPLESFSK